MKRRRARSQSAHQSRDFSRSGLIVSAGTTIPQAPTHLLPGYRQGPLPPPGASPSVSVQERYCTHVCTPTPTCPGLCELTTALTEMCPWQKHQGTCPVPWESAHGAGERRTSTKPSPGGPTARGYCVRGPGFLPREHSSVVPSRARERRDEGCDN